MGEEEGERERSRGDGGGHHLILVLKSHFLNFLNKTINTLGLVARLQNLDFGSDFLKTFLQLGFLGNCLGRGIVLLGQHSQTSSDILLAFLQPLQFSSGIMETSRRDRRGRRGVLESFDLGGDKLEAFLQFGFLSDCLGIGIVFFSDERQTTVEVFLALS